MFNCPALMTRKKKFLAGVTVVLVVGLYTYVYMDWFRPAQMQIFHRLSAGTSTQAGAGAKPLPQATTVAFGFDRKYELRDVKVVAVDELATNAYAHPLWHLVSDSNSIPVNGFIYGVRIRGMRPSVKRARPDPLQSNVTYRLFVETSRQKGQYDFLIGGKKNPGQ